MINFFTSAANRVIIYKPLSGITIFYGAYVMTNVSPAREVLHTVLSHEIKTVSQITELSKDYIARSNR